MDTKTHSAGLTLAPETHTVSKGAKQVRLSPVNMRVLQVLVAHAESTVGRQTLFDQVWPNQVVSDDALTRAIADVRAQLKTLSDEPLIQTVPKKGYLWIHPIGQANMEGAGQWLKALLLWVSMVVFAVLLLVLVLRWWLTPKGMAVVVLPNEAQVVASGETSDLTDAVKSMVMQTEGMHYLSDHAFLAHQDNPYPYFSHQFGVRWFIDSRSDDHSITLTLIDARTGLVMAESVFSTETGTDWRHNGLNFIQNLMGD